MKRLLYIVMIALMAVACADAPESVVPTPSTPTEGTPVEMTLGFSAEAGDIILTRHTMDNISDESKIYNIYIFIFDADGNKIFGKYYNDDNKGSDWSVTTQPTGDSQTCNGTIKVNTIAQTGCTIYGIANIDREMENLSEEKFGFIQKESDLVNMTATLKQKIVERTGYFAMCGRLTGVNTGALSGTLNLERVDAKVQFWVKIAAGSDIHSLEVDKWEVVNVPSDTYLMNRTIRTEEGVTDPQDSQLGYFNSGTKNIEKEQMVDGKPQYGFSFYMLENMLTPKKTATQYADREKQEKSVDGLNGTWEYANDRSTYVVIHARLVMDTDYDIDGNVQQGATLNADARYIIHLGDFDNPNDFATKRNTSYTYTINVLNATDIRVEVETSSDDDETNFSEPSPGATGTVTIALQEILNCDAHYSSHVLLFNAKHFVADDVTWYVKTPFSEGQPQRYGDTDVTTGLDFKWVEFRRNKLDAGTYTNNRRLYKPHPTKKKPGTEEPLYEGDYFDDGGNIIDNPEMEVKTMYIDELVQYLRSEKAKFDADVAAGIIPNINAGTVNGTLSSAFRWHSATSYTDRNGNLVTNSAGWYIKFTAFVDEFYYEEHPLMELPDAERVLLWKQVVNQVDDRVMHILSDTRVSYDQESKIIGSAITIQQMSIQSPYNQTVGDLVSAWGAEHVDEDPKRDYTSESPSGGGTRSDRGNTDSYNGRWNTMCEWEVINNPNGNSPTFKNDQYWTTYLDMEVDNRVPELRDDYRYLRYSCMTRNRDNNGDGIMQQEEIRWYMASVKQLTGIWMGADALDNSARLYNRSTAQKQSNNVADWRQHVVSSTADGYLTTSNESDDNSNNPIIVWAEEGSSTGVLSRSTSDGGSGMSGQWTIRCVRNLGLEEEDKTSLKVAPQDYVIVDNTDPSNPVFDLTRMNKKCIRYLGQDGINLVYADENSPENRLYWKFQATSVGCSVPSSTDFREMQANINTALGNKTYDGCPAGYRLPNQRELALMHLYCANSFWASSGICFSRTYFSFGNNGPDDIRKENNKTGWAREGQIYMQSNTHKATYSRCVRDIEVPGMD